MYRNTYLPIYYKYDNSMKKKTEKQKDIIQFTITL